MSGIDVFWIAFVAAVALLAARYAARFKGRSESATRWGAACFFLPMLLPIFSLYRQRPGTTPARPLVAIPILALANLVVLTPIAGYAWNIYYTGGEQLPSCSSRAALDTARIAFDGGPAAKLMGWHLVDISQPIQTSATDLERRCEAKVLVSNGADTTALYRVFTRPGSDNWFVTIELTGQ